MDDRNFAEDYAVIQPLVSLYFIPNQKLLPRDCSSNKWRDGLKVVKLKRFTNYQPIIYHSVYRSQPFDNFVSLSIGDESNNTYFATLTYKQIRNLVRVTNTQNDKALKYTNNCVSVQPQCARRSFLDNYVRL